jgi:hypothetical protein
MPLPYNSVPAIQKQKQLSGQLHPSPRASLTFDILLIEKDECLKGLRLDCRVDVVEVSSQSNESSPCTGAV